MEEGKEKMPGIQSQAGSQTASPQAQAAQQNKAIRQMLLKRAVARMIPLTAVSLSSAQAAGTTPVSIVPQSVGFLTKFIIEITGTMNNTDGADTATLSDIGLANLIGQIQFIDTQSNTRIQTAGWHLDFLFRAKHRWGSTSAILSSAVIESGNFGNNFNVLVAPTDVTHGQSQPFRMVFELPITYSDDDLRGGVWLGVVNAPAQLNITLTTNPFAPSGDDSTLSCWQGAAGNISGVTIQVYQCFLDQVPLGKTGAPVLPPLDISTVYELKNTFNPTVLVQGQDNPLSYSNFRRFMSTMVIYNDNPSGNAGRPNPSGTDINYFALQAANFTNIWKKFPLQVAREARVLTLQDLPPGCYYFSHRKMPISTIAYGNMQLILNPSLADAGAYELVGWEDFAPLNAVAQAGSLA
jgi:hypothetical protein